MYLCMRKWKYIFSSNDTTQSHASKRDLFTHTHIHTNTLINPNKRQKEAMEKGKSVGMGKGCEDRGSQ